MTFTLGIVHRQNRVLRHVVLACWVGVPCATFIYPEAEIMAWTHKINLLVKLQMTAL